MSLPDASGHYELFGGKYVPEALYAALAQLEAEFDKAMDDPSFWAELDDLRRNYSAFVKRTVCDQNSRFSFSGLANGAWYVITVAKPVGAPGPDHIMFSSPPSSLI